MSALRSGSLAARVASIWMTGSALGFAGAGAGCAGLAAGSVGPCEVSVGAWGRAEVLAGIEPSEPSPFVKALVGVSVVKVTFSCFTAG